MGMTEDEMVEWHHQLSWYELRKLQKIVKDKEVWLAAVHGVAENWTWLSDWTTTKVKYEATWNLLNKYSYKNTMNNHSDLCLDYLMAWGK